MADIKEPRPEVARVDALVDENGARIGLPEDSGIRIADEHDAIIAGTGPTNWWLYGLIGLGIVIAVLLVMQLLQGAPATDMQSGTPTSQSVVAPALPAAQ